MAALIGVFMQELFADGMTGVQAIILYTILAIMTILWQFNAQTNNITTPQGSKTPVETKKEA